MIDKVQKLLLLFGFFCTITAGYAQTAVIVQKNVAVSRTLAGHVSVGITKVPAKDITVELCSPDWQTVLSSTKTDNNGYFFLEKPAAGKLFNIRLSAPGVNPYRLRVRIKEDGAQELTIHLDIAA